MTTQTEMDLSPLDHLGPEAVETVNNIINVVASQQPTFTWEDVEAQLPEGVRAQIESKALRRHAPGALMRNAMTLFNLTRITYAPAKNPASRGRAIRVYGRAAR